MKDDIKLSILEDGHLMVSTHPQEVLEAILKQMREYEDGTR